MGKIRSSESVSRKLYYCFSFRYWYLSLAESL